MLNGDAVIRVDNLAKRYTIGHEVGGLHQYQSFRDTLARRVRSIARSASDMLRGRQIIPGDEVEEFWALRDVSFEVKQGEVLGIIGPNGAGKSTLLKVLSRITEPTSGRVAIRGRVASLLEVGTGFHPELTGRENIFLNGAILGMKKAEIRARFDEIVAFAAVERFLDTPVKRYSSGMYVRLAFAVAAHLEPEILIVDEVLSVGDLEFQRKCLGKMKGVAEGEGRTVLFVSHNIPAIQQLCGSALLLDQGRIAARGPVEQTLNTYMDTLDRIARLPMRERSDREGNGELRITDVTLHDERGNAVSAATCGRALRLRIHYESRFTGAEQAVDAAFNLTNRDGVLLTCFANAQTGTAHLPLHAHGYLECHWPKVNLRSGKYRSTVFVAVNGDTCDWLKDAFQLEIEEGNYFGTGNLVPREEGELLFDQSWTSVRG